MFFNKKKNKPAPSDNQLPPLPSGGSLFAPGLNPAPSLPNRNPSPAPLWQAEPQATEQAAFQTLPPVSPTSHEFANPPEENSPWGESPPNQVSNQTTSQAGFSPYGQDLPPAPQILQPGHSEAETPLAWELPAEDIPWGNAPDPVPTSTSTSSSTTLPVAPPEQDVALAWELPVDNIPWGDAPTANVAEPLTSTATPFTSPPEPTSVSELSEPPEQALAWEVPEGQNAWESTSLPNNPEISPKQPASPFDSGSIPAFSHENLDNQVWQVPGNNPVWETSTSVPESKPDPILPVNTAPQDAKPIFDESIWASSPTGKKPEISSTPSFQAETLPVAEETALQWDLPEAAHVFENPMSTSMPTGELPLPFSDVLSPNMGSFTDQTPKTPPYSLESQTSGWEADIEISQQNTVADNSQATSNIWETNISSSSTPETAESSLFGEVTALPNATHVPGILRSDEGEAFETPANWQELIAEYSENTSDTLIEDALETPHHFSPSRELSDLEAAPPPLMDVKPSYWSAPLEIKEEITGDTTANPAHTEESFVQGLSDNFAIQDPFLTAGYEPAPSATWHDAQQFGAGTDNLGAESFQSSLQEENNLVASFAHDATTSSFWDIPEPTAQEETTGSESIPGPWGEPFPSSLSSQPDPFEGIASSTQESPWAIPTDWNLSEEEQDEQKQPTYSGWDIPEPSALPSNTSPLGSFVDRETETSFEYPVIGEFPQPSFDAPSAYEFSTDFQTHTPLAGFEEFDSEEGLADSRMSMTSATGYDFPNSPPIEAPSKESASIEFIQDHDHETLYPADPFSSSPIDPWAQAETDFDSAAKSLFPESMGLGNNNSDMALNWYDESPSTTGITDGVSDPANNPIFWPDEVLNQNSIELGASIQQDENTAGFTDIPLESGQVPAEQSTLPGNWAETDFPTQAMRPEQLIPEAHSPVVDDSVATEWIFPDAPVASPLELTHHEELRSHEPPEERQNVLSPWETFPTFGISDQLPVPEASSNHIETETDTPLWEDGTFTPSWTKAVDPADLQNFAEAQEQAAPSEPVIQEETHALSSPAFSNQEPTSPNLAWQDEEETAVTQQETLPEAFPSPALSKASFPPASTFLPAQDEPTPEVPVATSIQPTSIPTPQPEYIDVPEPPAAKLGKLDILGVCPISADKRLLVVNNGEVYALMGQSGMDESAQIAVLKIFDRNPLAYQSTFTAVPDNRPGKEGLYMLQIGSQHGQLSLFQDKMSWYGDLS